MAGPNGELDWSARDPKGEIAEYIRDSQSSTGTFLFGRVTYEMMASFWPTPAGKAESPIFAKILNNSPKIVFSRTLKEATWENTRLVREITKEGIMKLKQQPGNDMLILGSGTLVQQLTNLGLIDEYQLMVNPVILGSGKPLFKEVNSRIDLKMEKAKTFGNGVVLLQYRRNGN